MKKKDIFEVPLLLTQDEIACLLGITRSLWAMYTKGERGLAVAGKIKLEHLIASANQVSFFKKEKLEKETVHEEERNIRLQSLLRDNQIKQFKTKRKINEMKRKYQAAINTIHFIKNCHAYGLRENIDESIFQVIRNKANMILDKNNLGLQEVHKLKMEVLIYEEKLLKNQLKKLQ